MLRLLQLPTTVEALVLLVEQTPSERIVEETLESLRAGTPPRDMLTASALAVSRASELPADHHGGPVHPVSGIHGVHHLSRRLTGDARFLPIVQNVALANKHIHDVETGPTAMLALEPLEAEAGASQTTAQAFVTAMAQRHPLAAERYLLALLERCKPGEILDLIMSVALPRAALDEHHFNYPVFAARALDDIGWEWADVILRPAVRYVAGHPPLYGAHGFPDHYVDELLRNYRDFATLERLIEEYRLLEVDPAAGGGEHETAWIGELGERIGEPGSFRRIPHLIAAALAAGLSLDGAGEALSIGAAMLALRGDFASADEVHMHTAVNARRYLLNLDGISLKTKLLGLLSWNRDPEIHFAGVHVRVPERTPYRPRADAAVIDALPSYCQDELLDAISESVAAQPVIPAERARLEIRNLVVWPKVRHTLALAQKYAQEGYDSEAYFARVAELAGQDDVSEMHGYKFQQAVYEEFHNVAPPYRWVHLVAAIRHVAFFSGVQPKGVYARVTRALAA